MKFVSRRVSNSRPVHNTRLHALRTLPGQWALLLSLGVGLVLLLAAQLLLAGYPQPSTAIKAVDQHKSSFDNSSITTTGAHAALLDAKWLATSFTNVIRHPWHAPGVYDSHLWQPSTSASMQAADYHVLGSAQQQQPSPGTQPGNSTALTLVQDEQQRVQDNQKQHGSLARNTDLLSNPPHPEIMLLKQLAAAAMAGPALQDTEVREAYLAGFQAVPPPPGHPPWQVKLPAQLAAEAAAAAEAAQHQHKGAQYYPVHDGAAAVAPGEGNVEGDDDDESHVPLDVLKGWFNSSASLEDEAAVTAAAAAAKHFLQMAPQPTSQLKQQPQDATSKHAAELLMQHALLLLKRSHQWAPCGTDDASMPYQVLKPGQQPRRTLLAVTLTDGDSHQALPNLVLQITQFVLQAPTGSLHISVVDSRSHSQYSTSTMNEGSASSSSSTSSTGSDLGVDYYLDMLQLLLAPLHVPIMVQQLHSYGQGDAGAPPSRSTTLAAARNTAIASFFDNPGSSCHHGRQADSSNGSSGGSYASSSIVDNSGHGNGEPQTAQHQHDGTSTTSSVESSSSIESSQLHHKSHRRSLTSRLPPAAGLKALMDTASGEAAMHQRGTGDQQAAMAIAPAATVPDAAAGAAEDAANDKHPYDEAACFNPESVVFIDGSSLFCKSDLMRIMLHHTADLACGMDLHVAEPSPPTSAAAATAAANDTTSSSSSMAAAATASAMTGSTRHLQQLLSSLQRRLAAYEPQQLLHIHHQQHTELQLQLRQRQHQQQQLLLGSSLAAAAALAAHHATSERPPSMDLWKHPVLYAGASTGRMLNGMPFSAAPYFAGSHAPTLRRLAAGVPTQAYCCWGGLAKLAAEPFKQGLRFRSQSQPGECPTATDRSLLCSDLHRMGFHKVLIDAGVLLSHTLDVTLKVTPVIRAADRAPYIRRSRWVEVQGSGFEWDVTQMSLQHTEQSLQCCRDPLEEQPLLPWQLGGSSSSSSSQRQHWQQWQRQHLLTVDELVAAAGAGRRPGGPLHLRGWDAEGCQVRGVMQGDHTAEGSEGLPVPQS